MFPFIYGCIGYWLMFFIAVYIYWLGLRGIGCLLSQRYTLFPEAKPRAMGWQTCYFPKCPVNKCFIILNKNETDINMATKLRGGSKRKVFKKVKSIPRAYNQKNYLVNRYIFNTEWLNLCLLVDVTTTLWTVNKNER